MKDMYFNAPPPTRTMLEDTAVFRKAINEHVQQELQTIFGLPVVVTDTVAEGEIMCGAFPPPEHDGMTLEEYAEQSARYFTKIKTEE